MVLQAQLVSPGHPSTNTTNLYIVNVLLCFQVHTFYEAVGYMIGAQTDQAVQEHLIEKYMLLPNQVWDSIIQQATKVGHQSDFTSTNQLVCGTENSSVVSLLCCQNVDILKDPETVKQLGSILKTNVRACKAVGHPFVIQLGRIYLDMLNVYKCLSENISAAIQTNGEESLRHNWTTTSHDLLTSCSQSESTTFTKDTSIICEAECLSLIHLVPVQVRW